MKDKITITIDNIRNMMKIPMYRGLNEKDIIDIFCEFDIRHEDLIYNIAENIIRKKY